jgi:hypothetical protein
MSYQIDPLSAHFYAVDPGDIHVGLAEFRGGRCIAASETRPEAFCDMLFDLSHESDRSAGPNGVRGEMAPDLVVLERFALRGELMAQQQGSEFLTSQMIGAIRFICRRGGIPLVIQTPQQHKLIPKREPWKSWPLRRWTSYGHGPHAKSAEMHGLFYLQEQLRGQSTVRMHQWLESLG